MTFLKTDMSKKQALFTFLLILFIALPSPVWSQLILGQYEDEAPFRTWNTVGILNGTSLALGGAHFSVQSDCSVSFTNPALLSELPGFSFAINTSLDSASFFKYSIVNTGVLSTEENPTQGILALDYAGAAYNYKGWAFSINLGLIENYDRPPVKSKYAYEGTLYYTLDFQQEGFLKNINLSFAGRPHRKIAVGIGLNFVSGHLKKSIEEDFVQSNITILDRKTHEYKGFYINGGALLHLSSRVSAGIMFRTPYSKKAESESLQQYVSPGGDTDIKIEASAENSYEQPLIMGLGFAYRFSEHFTAVSDLTYFRWSSYSITYFDEDLKRNFRDVLKVGAGIEYITSIKVFNQSIPVPLRTGICFDPQPMKDPASRYLSFSFGTGIRWKRFFLDIGALFGSERGSGDNLSGQRFTVTLGYKGNQ
jgi:hypothetical protein